MNQQMVDDGNLARANTESKALICVAAILNGFPLHKGRSSKTILETCPKILNSSHNSRFSSNILFLWS